MSERLNFICIGNRVLEANEYRQALEGILHFLAPLSATPTDVLRLKSETSESATLPWDKADPLFEKILEPDHLIFSYFKVTGKVVSDRQSITLESKEAATVITLSFNPLFFRDENPEQWSASKVLVEFSGWALETFQDAALACGPELDLYEVGSERDIRLIEKRLASDWRCRLSMSTHRTASNT
jgi:hypothetical protein